MIACAEIPVLQGLKNKFFSQEFSVNNDTFATNNNKIVAVNNLFRNVFTPITCILSI